MDTFEEQKARVAQMNVIDDGFFQKMVDDIEVAEEILRIILEKPKLKIIKSQTQRFLRNNGAHSVVLDLICEDEDHSIIHVEVQKKDDDDHQKRVRFNVSNIDTVFTEKGKKYRELPEVYAVFISRFDVFELGKTIYHISRVIDETGDRVDNGIHEIYVNAKVDDGSDIAELMRYFVNSVGEHKKFMKLCKRVKYFKESQEGVAEMCQVIEDYANQKQKEFAIVTATNLLKNGATVKMIVDSMPSLTKEFVEGLMEQINNHEI